MMNKSLSYLGAIIIAITLSGCGDDFNPYAGLEPTYSPHYLRADLWYIIDSYNISSYGETGYLYVESLNTPWAFSDIASWFSLTPNKGDDSADVRIEVSENTITESRTAIFYLESTSPEWEYRQAISISQDESAPYITPSVSEIGFGGGAESATIDVSANCNWEAITDDSSSKYWVNLIEDVENGTLSISVLPNPYSYYRSCEILLNFNDGYYKVNAYITLKQAPSEVKSSDTSLLYENYASKYDITLESEADWETVTSDSWIQVTPPSGAAGKSNVSIEVTPNTSVKSRHGYVTFMTGLSEKLQIAIEQQGIYFNVDSQDISFVSTGESKNFSVESNTSWEIISAPNWLSFSKTAGSGNDKITVTASDNPNTTSRSGQIVLGKNGLSIKHTINVTQTGKTFSINTNFLQFTDKGGTQSFDIVTDASWSSTVSDNWFSSTPVNGKGNATIEVFAEENKSVDERSGTISYIYADKTATVNVMQMAKYMTITNQSFDFSSKGGSHTIDLLTNDTWSAEIENSASWLHLSKMSGSGSETLTLTVDDNPSVNVRSTAVVINTESSQSVRILVSQQSRHLSVSSLSVLFFANGGTSRNITIDTDGEFEITSAANWLTINRNTDNSFSVEASANLIPEIREDVITISLTDLKEGSLSVELRVRQLGRGGSFITNKYPEDSNWGTTQSGSLNLSITNYTSDKNWDNGINSSMTVTITGYTTENDWNRKTSSSATITINHYGQEKDFNNTTNTNGTINSSTYKNDSNWNN